MKYVMKGFPLYKIRSTKTTTFVFLPSVGKRGRKGAEEARSAYKYKSPKAFEEKREEKEVCTTVARDEIAENET